LKLELEPGATLDWSDTGTPILSSIDDGRPQKPAGRSSHSSIR
jgi:hypothetical protein